MSAPHGSDTEKSPPPPYKRQSWLHRFIRSLCCCCDGCCTGREATESEKPLAIEQSLSKRRIYWKRFPAPAKRDLSGWSVADYRNPKVGPLQQPSSSTYHFRPFDWIAWLITWFLAPTAFFLLPILLGYHVGQGNLWFLGSGYFTTVSGILIGTGGYHQATSSLPGNMTGIIGLDDGTGGNTTPDYVWHWWFWGKALTLGGHSLSLSSPWAIPGILPLLFAFPTAVAAFCIKFLPCFVAYHAFRNQDRQNLWQYIDIKVWRADPPNGPQRRFTKRRFWRSTIKLWRLIYRSPSLVRPFNRDVGHYHRNLYLYNLFFWYDFSFWAWAAFLALEIVAWCTTRNVHYSSFLVGCTLLLFHLVLQLMNWPWLWRSRIDFCHDFWNGAICMPSRRVPPFDPSQRRPEAIWYTHFFRTANQDVTPDTLALVTARHVSKSVKRPSAPAYTKGGNAGAIVPNTLQTTLSEKSGGLNMIQPSAYPSAVGELGPLPGKYHQDVIVNRMELPPYPQNLSQPGIPGLFGSDLKNEKLPPYTADRWLAQSDMKNPPAAYLPGSEKPLPYVPTVLPQDDLKGVFQAPPVANRPQTSDARVSTANGIPPGPLSNGRLWQDGMGPAAPNAPGVVYTGPLSANARDPPVANNGYRRPAGSEASYDPTQPRLRGTGGDSDPRVFASQKLPDIEGPNGDATNASAQPVPPVYNSRNGPPPNGANTATQQRMAPPAAPAQPVVPPPLTQQRSQPPQAPEPQPGPVSTQTPQAPAPPVAQKTSTAQPSNPSVQNNAPAAKAHPPASAPATASTAQATASNASAPPQVQSKSVAPSQPSAPAQVAPATTAPAPVAPRPVQQRPQGPQQPQQSNSAPSQTATNAGGAGRPAGVPPQNFQRSASMNQTHSQAQNPGQNGASGLQRSLTNPSTGANGGLNGEPNNNSAQTASRGLNQRGGNGYNAQGGPPQNGMQSRSGSNLQHNDGSPNGPSVGRSEQQQNGPPDRSGQRGPPGQSGPQGQHEGRNPFDSQGRQGDPGARGNQGLYDNQEQSDGRGPSGPSRPGEDPRNSDPMANPFGPDGRSGNGPMNTSSGPMSLNRDMENQSMTNPNMPAMGQQGPNTTNTRDLRQNGLMPGGADINGSYAMNGAVPNSGVEQSQNAIMEPRGPPGLGDAQMPLNGVMAGSAYNNMGSGPNIPNFSLPSRRNGPGDVQMPLGNNKLAPMVGLAGTSAREPPPVLPATAAKADLDWKLQKEQEEQYRAAQILSLPAFTEPLSNPSARSAQPFVPWNPQYGGGRPAYGLPGAPPQPPNSFRGPLTQPGSLQRGFMQDSDPFRGPQAPPRAFMPPFQNGPPPPWGGVGYNGRGRETRQNDMLGPNSSQRPAEHFGPRPSNGDFIRRQPPTVATVPSAIGPTTQADSDSNVAPAPQQVMARDVSPGSEVRRTPDSEAPMISKEEAQPRQPDGYQAPPYADPDSLNPPPRPRERPAAFLPPFQPSSTAPAQESVAASGPAPHVQASPPQLTFGDGAGDIVNPPAVSTIRSLPMIPVKRASGLENVQHGIPGTSSGPPAPPPLPQELDQVHQIDADKQGGANLKAQKLSATATNIGDASRTASNIGHSKTARAMFQGGKEVASAKEGERGKAFVRNIQHTAEVYKSDEDLKGALNQGRTQLAEARGQKHSDASSVEDPKAAESGAIMKAASRIDYVTAAEKVYNINSTLNKASTSVLEATDSKFVKGAMLVAPPPVKLAYTGVTTAATLVQDGTDKMNKHQDDVYAVANGANSMRKGASALPMQPRRESPDDANIAYHPEVDATHSSRMQKRPDDLNSRQAPRWDVPPAMYGGPQRGLPAWPGSIPQGQNKMSHPSFEQAPYPPQYADYGMQQWRMQQGGMQQGERTWYRS